jgi:PTS system galactitol-specific IIC component
MVIAGTITLGLGFYIATGMSSFFTTVAMNSGFDMPPDAAQITSIADGFLWPPFLFLVAAQNAGIIGLIVLLVLLAVAMYMYLRNTQAWETAAGAPVEQDEAQPKFA